LLAVILLSLLSVLFLLLTNSVLMGTKARSSIQASMEMLYIAEAGLAHGQAFCAAHGQTSPILTGTQPPEGEEGAPGGTGPFDVWLPFGPGEYRLEVFRLNKDAQTFLKRDEGLLLVAVARRHGLGRRRACLLLDDPPSCLPIAWWEPA
jgi:hypothetical protein